MPKIVSKPTKPDRAHVDYWSSKGWEHKGLGLFENRDGFLGRLHVYEDGSTGIRVLDFCAITSKTKETD